MPDITTDIKIAVVTISDRAHSGEYEDLAGPAVLKELNLILTSPWEAVERIIPDEQEVIEKTLIELADDEACSLIITTGGTGPAPRDVTPDATSAVTSRTLPGFGELMRRISLKKVPTAILSRQMAAIRDKTLIVNLPGKPSAIAECLRAVFPAIPDCINLIGAGTLETDPDVVKAFLPHK